MKPAVLLQTDFSLTWGAVASMKGVMKRVDPTLELIDLCHDIKAFDPWEASLSLSAVEPCWPSGTVFVSVVDPGVGTHRRACAAKLLDGSFVVTPDNGTLTHLKHGVGIAEIREIDERTNRWHGLEEVSVFHGRDLFGYCAARLAAGVISFAEIGACYPVEEIVECEEYRLLPRLEAGRAAGFLMTGLHHFGGVTASITNQDFLGCGFSEGDMTRVVISKAGRRCFDAPVPFVHAFGDVPQGAVLLYRGSSGYLCLDVNQGNFMKRFDIGFGREWTISIENMNT